MTKNDCQHARIKQLYSDKKKRRKGRKKKNCVYGVWSDEQRARDRERKSEIYLHVCAKRSLLEAI